MVVLAVYKSLQPSLIVLRPRWTKLFAYADVLALRALNIVPDLLGRDTRSIRFVSGWLTSLSILLSRLGTGFVDDLFDARYIVFAA